MTTLLYHDPDGPLTTTATVVAVGHDDAGRWVTLDQTVAHCHGGGQLADLGRLDDLAILDVRRVEGQVRHYLDGPPPSVGTRVDLAIDADRRHQMSAWHTSGHLLAAVLEQCLPGLTIDRANQHPSDAWCAGAWSVDVPEGFLERVQQGVDVAIAANLPVAVSNGALRHITIGAFAPVPCGGTHLCRTSELGNLLVERFRVKKGVLKVTYVLAPAS